jgi:glyoxylase-like metal-dependent hydrolase (beta-lactamase superfamily II)/rhodanese-related sulfurtransferase
VIFEQISSGGCQSYLVGCEETCAAALIDPEISQIDRTLALAAKDGLRIRYLIDTHTHADHFSATQELARRLEVPVIMHRQTRAPYVDMRVDDGEMILVGNLRLRVLHTPGHTRDSICLVLPDRVLTGDTLLIGGTGRTDLPTGDASALYESLFHRLLTLDPKLAVYPAHDYRKQGSSTLEHEIATNPRLQPRDRAAFIEMMGNLNLGMPTHLTEALRTNMNGGKTVAQLLSEAAAKVSFMSMEELNRRIESGEAGLLVLDVRERDAYLKGHIPGAKLLPRGQLELRVNQELPDPTRRVLVYCDFGKVSTLAAATLREMGYTRAVALDGGMVAWSQAGYAVAQGAP